MLDALSLLDESPDVVGSLPDLVGTVALEAIDGRTYGEAPGSGLSFVVGTDGRIRTLHLYSDGHENFARFIGTIPFGIRFDMSRANVRAILGSPSASGEPRQIEHYGEGAAWDRFAFDAVQMHVEYRGDQRSIQLVTLMKESAVPGRTL